MDELIRNLIAFLQVAVLFCIGAAISDLANVLKNKK